MHNNNTHMQDGLSRLFWLLMNPSDIATLFTLRVPLVEFASSSFLSCWRSRFCKNPMPTLSLPMQHSPNIDSKYKLHSHTLGQHQLPQNTIKWQEPSRSKCLLKAAQLLIGRKSIKDITVANIYTRTLTSTGQQNAQQHTLLDTNWQRNSILAT
jgi:hypothetical protein